MNKGSIVERLCSGLDRKEPRYKWSTLLYFTYDTGSIKFTAEQEQDEQMPFLDSLIVRKADGRVKLLVYRKKTHTDK